jgi:hypothetical protein
MRGVPSGVVEDEMNASELRPRLCWFGTQRDSLGRVRSANRIFFLKA